MTLGQYGLPHSPAAPLSEYTRYMELRPRHWLLLIVVVGIDGLEIPYDAQILSEVGYSV